MKTLAPAIIAAAVALVVAVLTPAVTSLRGRRQAIDLLFDQAIAALLLAQAARQISTGIARSYHPGSDEQYERFQVAMVEDSITHFVHQMRLARAALVTISRYVPETREWVSGGWELAEEREPEQRRVIESRRAAAKKSERLFRQSRGAAS